MDSVCLDACLSHDRMYGPSRIEIGAMWGKRHICKTGPNKGFQIPNMQPEARILLAWKGSAEVLLASAQSSLLASSLVWEPRA